MNNIIALMNQQENIVKASEGRGREERSSYGEEMFQTLKYRKVDRRNPVTNFLNLTDNTPVVNEGQYLQRVKLLISQLSIYTHRDETRGFRGTVGYLSERDKFEVLRILGIKGYHGIIDREGVLSVW